MDSGAVLGTVGIVISVITAIVSALNHTRIRSSCCKKEIEATFDIDKNSPAENKKPIIEDVSGKSESSA